MTALTTERNMKRSEVVEHVVLMPMKVKTQWEDDEVVAVMPCWVLPHNLIVKGRNTREAIAKLEALMRQHWGPAKGQYGLHTNT
jgi:hypothetical protein